MWSDTAVGVRTGNNSRIQLCVWVCLQVTVVRYSCVCVCVCLQVTVRYSCVCMGVLTGNNSQIQLCVYGCVYR